jgi:hypothetical protein
LRRWLIALAIAALLLGGLWALWSAHASASNDVESHSASHDEEGLPFVPVRRGPDMHAPSLRLAGNAASLDHLPGVGKIWDSDSSQSTGFSPPDKLPFLDALPTGDDRFNFPFEGIWHGFSNQGTGPGIGGPGGAPAGSSAEATPSEESSHPPGTVDGAEPGPGNPVNNSDLASAVPEPATWVMMLIGFGAIGFAKRRAKLQSR